MTDRDVQATIETLVNRLSKSSVRDMYRVLHSDELKRDDNGVTIRDAVIRRLNGQRTQHARRLFLEIFEPLICDDPRLLQSPRYLPGCFHRLDTGALWTLVSTQLIPDIAAEASDRLNALCRQAPVEDVLAGNEAAELRERMRTATIDALKQKSKRERAQRRLVNFLNEQRVQDLMPVLGAVDVTPLGTRFLNELQTVLALAPVLTPATRSALDALSQLMANDEPAQAQSRELADRIERLRPALQAEGFDPDSAVYLPLPALYRHKAILAVAELTHAQYGTAIARTIEEALLAYVELTTRSMGHGLLLTLGVEDTDDPAPFALDSEARERLTTSAAEFRDVLASSEYLARRDHAAAIDMVDKLANVVAMRVLTAVGARVTAAADSIEEAVEDYDNILWTLDYINKLYELVGDRPTLHRAYTNFRQRFVHKLHTAFTQTARAGHLDADVRFAHLVRLTRLADRLGQSAGAWITPTAKSVIATLWEVLAQEIELDSTGRWLMREAISMAKDELARTRYWADEDLTQLLDAAKRSSRLRSRRAL